MGQPSNPSADWPRCPPELKGKHPMFCTRCFKNDRLSGWWSKKMYFSDWHERKHDKLTIHQKTIGEFRQ